MDVHPHLARRKAAGPATVDAQRNRSNGVARFNATLAVAITKAVGSMGCAYLFALIALVSLPSAIASGDPVVVVQWLSSVFLQLVLLAVILVGGNVQGKAADKRAVDTFADTEAILSELVKLRTQLEAR